MFAAGYHYFFLVFYQVLAIETVSLAHLFGLVLLMPFSTGCKRLAFAYLAMRS